MKFLRMFATGIFALLLVGTSLFAQGVSGTSGTLTGTVVDEKDAPLPGVLVSVSGDMGTRTVTTDSSGKFLFPYLAPGTYDVVAELASYQTIEQSGIEVRLAQRVEVTFKMKLGREEAIVVLGESPGVDVTSTTTGASISNELVSSIPIPRGFAGVVSLAPGVVDSGIAGSNVSISGGSGLDNQYIVDGVNITDAGYGSIGTYSGTYGSLGSGFPVDFVKETQVKTGGFEPEYGGAIGGVVNVVTKSGGNRFTGDAFVNFQPGSLEGDIERVNLAESLAVNLAERENTDGGINIGGRIIKDRLFFFGAYNPSRTQTTLLNDPEASSFAAFPTFDRVRKTNAYAFKATGNATPNHSFEFSAFGDPATGELGLQRSTAILNANPNNSTSSLNWGSNNQAVRYNGILSSSMFVEAQYGRFKSTYEETLGPTANQYLISNRTGAVRFNEGGLGSFDQNEIQTNDQYSVKLTNTFGPHEVRYGVAYQDVFYSGGIGYSGPLFTAANGTQSTTGATLIKRNCTASEGILGVDLDCAANPFTFTVTRARLSPSPVPTSTKYFNWFAQDSWNITDYLTVNAGVRWERQKIAGDLEGSADVTLSNNWGPRVGGTWDFRKNGKSKIYGHYGRFFEKIPQDLAIRALVNEVTPNGYYYDQDLTRSIPGTFGLLGSYIFEFEGQSDPDILGRPVQDTGYVVHAQFNEEYVIGAEQEVGGGIVFGGRYIHRQIGNVLEDVQIDFTRPVEDTGSGFLEHPVMRAEDFVQNCLTLGQCAYFVTNQDGHMPGLPVFTRDYDAVEITAEKRFSHNYQFLTSYRWARLNGIYEGLYQRSNGQDDPNITTLGDFAISPFMGFTLTDGPMPNDRPHNFKFFGSNRWNMGLTTGVGVNFASGRPITARGNVPLYGPSTRELTEKGGLGRTPDIYTLDVQADYGINIGEDQRVSFGFNVFNVFNQQKATDIYEDQEEFSNTYEAPPDDNFRLVEEFQLPREIRFFARFSF